jgi:hypothetical protein
MLTCAACSSVTSTIDGQYSGPNGATLKLDGKRYEFCQTACSGGAMEVRHSGQRSGRVTFYGVPVAGYFRNAQGPSTTVRTWGDGVETGYRLGALGGAYIDIDPGRGLYFERTGVAPRKK